MKIPKVFLLAAGRGSRMGELTDHCPKPLLKIGTQTLIGNNICKLQQAGFVDIIINTFYLGEMLEKQLGNGEQFGVRIHYSHESEILETAGGIIHALPILGNEIFILLNADVFCDYPFANLMHRAWQMQKQNNHANAHIILVDNPSHNLNGDFCLQNHLVSNLGAHPQTFTYSGIGIFRPQIFKDLPITKLALGSVLRELAASKKLSGEHYKGDWQDIGTPERLAKLRVQLSRA